MGAVTIKVPGGKLLRLKAEVAGGRLFKPQLSGDFFVMPSEKITSIERSLEGYKVADLATLSQRLEELLLAEGIELAGISCQAIADAAKQLAEQDAEGRP